METTESVLYQSAVTKYASVGALAVLIWDILDNIPADYCVLFKQRSFRKKLSLANCTYVSSRMGALAYQLTGVIFSTAPVKSCILLNDIAFGWCSLSIGATGLLFFLRLRAIYNHDNIIVAVFFIFWLALLASAVLLPIGMKGGAMGDTSYCKRMSESKLAFYSQLGPLSFDTLVFFAISWRLSRVGALTKTGLGAGKKAVNKMVFGTDLPTFTRSLLIDGQMYYLLTIVPGIASTALEFSLPLQDPRANLLNDSYLILINIMACRVFRRTRSGVIRESEISTSALSQTISAPIRFRLERGDDSSKDTASEEVSVV